MSKLNIIYFSTTGNTEQMAFFIEEGAKEYGVETDVISIDNVDTMSIEADYFAFGCSAMGAEEVAIEIMEYIEDNKDQLIEKKVGLFGSYDWGVGEWMELWINELKNIGIEVVEDGLIVNLTPDDDEKIESCREYGRKIINQ